MTVSATDVRRAYVGNASTDEFSAPYVLRSEDLTVYADGEVVDAADYTVTGIGEIAGSVVTFDEAPDTGVIIILVRNPSRIQPARWIEGARFPAAATEAEMDRKSMASQHALYLLERALRYQEHESGTYTPPSAAERAGMLQGYDQAGAFGLYDQTGLSEEDGEAIDMVQENWAFLGDRQYGVGWGEGDPEKDYEHVQAWLNDAAARNVLAYGDGEKEFLGSPWEYIGDRWGVTSRPILRVWELPSGVRMKLGKGVVFKPVPHSYTGDEITVDDNTIFHMFATDPNVETITTYQDIEIDGLNIDFAMLDAYGVELDPSMSSSAATAALVAAGVPQFQYGICVTGCTGLKLRNLNFYNSDEYMTTWSNGESEVLRSYRGRGIIAEGSAKIWLSDSRFHQLSQGWYVRYLDRVRVWNNDFTYLSECLDFDGLATNVRIWNNFFGFLRGERDAIDTGSGWDWIVKDNFFYDTGTAVKIYLKVNGHATYSLFLSNMAAGTPKITEANASTMNGVFGILVDGVYGRYVGLNSAGAVDETVSTDDDVRGHGSLTAGQYAQTGRWTGGSGSQAWTNTVLAGYLSPYGVTFRNIFLEDSGPINQGDCKDFVLENFELLRTRCRLSSQEPFHNGAVNLRQSNESEGSAAGLKLNEKTTATGTVRNGRIIDSNGSGLVMAGVGDYKVNDVTVDGFNKGFSARTAWLTATAYTVGQIRTTNTLTYECREAHTSGTFATDLGAGKWALVTCNVGFFGRSLGRKAAKITGRDIDVRGGENANDTVMAIDGAGVGSPASLMIDLGKPNLVARNGAKTFTWANSLGRKFKSRRIAPYTLGYDTTAADQEQPLDFLPQGGEIVTGFEVIPLAAVTGTSGTNYTDFYIGKRNSGGYTEMTEIGKARFDNTNRAAGDRITNDGTSFSTQAQIAAEGDRLILFGDRQGTGSAKTGAAVPLCIALYGLEYTSIGA